MESTSLLFFVAHILCGTSLGKHLGSYIQLDDAWSMLKNRCTYTCLGGTLKMDHLTPFISGLFTSRTWRIIPVSK